MCTKIDEEYDLLEAAGFTDPKPGLTHFNPGIVLPTQYWFDPTPEFEAWPKTPRLNRDMIVSEKIDGTNGCLVIKEDGEVYAQSRNRMLERPSDKNPKGTDNAGFRQWAEKNAEALFSTLGSGRHFGEWWGQGIQRGYGLAEKRFSLFNTAKWADVKEAGVPGLYAVPVLKKHTFDTAIANALLEILRDVGSQAAPGYMKPEGICVYHTASNQVFKATIDHDEKPKGFNG